MLIRSHTELKFSLNKINEYAYYYGILLKDEFSTFQVTFNQASDTLTTTTSNDVVNGLRVRLSNSGGAMPAEFNSATTYYLVGNDSATNSFQLAASKDGDPISFSSNGSGIHSITEQPYTAEDDFDVLVRHEVSYDSSQRYAFTIGTASVSNGVVAAPKVTLAWFPTTEIPYRWFVVIRDGSSSPGDPGGSLVGFEDHGNQVINSVGSPSISYTSQI